MKNSITRALRERAFTAIFMFVGPLGELTSAIVYFRRLVRIRPISFYAGGVRS